VICAKGIRGRLTGLLGLGSGGLYRYERYVRYFPDVQYSKVGLLLVNKYNGSTRGPTPSINLISSAGASLGFDGRCHKSKQGVVSGCQHCPKRVYAGHCEALEELFDRWKRLSSMASRQVKLALQTNAFLRPNVAEVAKVKD